MRKATAIILTFVGTALVTHSAAFFYGAKFSARSEEQSIKLCKLEGDALGVSTFFLQNNCFVTDGKNTRLLEDFKLHLTEKTPSATIQTPLIY